MKKLAALILIVGLCSGCAGFSEALGTKKPDIPPEYNQPVYLRVSDEYQLFQAAQSQHDMGDLQAFHTQHTLPIVVEGYFKEIFPQAKMLDDEAQIEMKPPDVPAVFEVRLLDLAHDIYDEPVRKYRSQAVLGISMTSPTGHVFWSQAFRGYGQATVDPQFSTGLGPEQAILDAMRDVMDQMQAALLASPEVRNQLRYYSDIEEARKKTEVKV